MHVARIFPGVVQFKAMDIYVFCGTTNGYQSGALSSIEHYKASNHTWKLFHITSQPNWRPRFGVAVLNLHHSQQFLVYGGSEVTLEAPCFHFDPKTKFIRTGKPTLRKAKNTQESLAEEPDDQEESTNPHILLNGIDLEHDNELIQKIVEATNQKYQYPQSARKASYVEPQLPPDNLPTAATHKVKSDTTHSEISYNKRNSRFKRKVEKGTLTKNYSHSPTARKMIESPYLKHLAKHSQDYRSVIQESKTQKSHISHNRSSALTSIHEETSIMGKAVPSINFTFRQNQVERVPENNLVFSALPPIEESINQLSRSKRTVRSKKGRKNKNTRKDCLVGIDGYSTPVVPVIQLGLFLTISKVVQSSKEDEWELCWFDQGDFRWRIGADWLAEELKVQYYEQMQPTYEDELTSIRRTKIQQSFTRNGTEQSEMKDHVLDFANFQQGIKRFPVGSSSFYSSMKKEPFLSLS